MNGYSEDFIHSITGTENILEKNNKNKYKFIFLHKVFGNKFTIIKKQN